MNENVTLVIGEKKTLATIIDAFNRICSMSIPVLTYYIFNALRDPQEESNKFLTLATVQTSNYFF